MSALEEVDAVLTEPPPAELVRRLDGRSESSERNGEAASAEKEASPSGQQSSEREYYCGCGPWHPPWLQVFRDARVFTFLLCLFATIEGALVSGEASRIASL